MKKGVVLLLEPGTQIKRWIKNQNLNIELGQVQLNKRMVRFLKIHGGEASFFPGGGVEIKMPGSDMFWIAFSPMKVFEIRDLENNLIERNHYLCSECAMLTGKIVSYKPSNICGLQDAIIKCSRCGNKWDLRI